MFGDDYRQGLAEFLDVDERDDEVIAQAGFSPACEALAEDIRNEVQSRTEQAGS